jgi:hypothetical protein
MRVLFRLVVMAAIDSAVFYRFHYSVSKIAVSQFGIAKCGLNPLIKPIDYY